MTAPAIENARLDVSMETPAMAERIMRNDSTPDLRREWAEIDAAAARAPLTAAEERERHIAELKSAAHLFESEANKCQYVADHVYAPESQESKSAWMDARHYRQRAERLYRAADALAVPAPAPPEEEEIAAAWDATIPGAVHGIGSRMIGVANPWDSLYPREQERIRAFVAALLLKTEKRA